MEYIRAKTWRMKMTDRFDEVRQLADLEKKATPGPWKWEDWEETINELGPGEYWLVAPPETNPSDLHRIAPDLGNNILADEERESSEEDRQLIADLRNASRWLTEVARCFQKGDADEIAYARDVLASDSRYTGDPRVWTRLLRAAKIMEGRE
jgi:hypothetical protein